MDQKNKNIDPIRKKRSGQTGVETNSLKRTKRFEIRFTQKEWEQLQKISDERPESVSPVPAAHGKSLM